MFFLFNETSDVLIHEAIDIVIMAFAIGFMFKDVFRYTPKVEILTPEYYIKKAKAFKWNDFWFAMAVVAPSIILHEFGHKFSALAFHMQAVFHAAYTWLAIGLVLKLMNFGFIFFVPAYTTISGGGTPLQMAIVAFAGPGVNLVLWLVSKAILILDDKKKIHLSTMVHHLLFVVSRINMFLFIFNMLPIPMFDGWSVYSNLYRAFF